MRRSCSPTSWSCPHALGQEVRFVEDEGPRLDPVDGCRRSRPPRGGAAARAPRPGLRDPGARCARPCRSETTLLGFCGAPWTVATYMIAGKGTPDQAPARLAAYRDPAFMRRADRSARRRLDRLSHAPDRGRRRGGADLRELRAGPAAGALRAAGPSSPIGRIVAGAQGGAAPGADHRLRARRAADILRPSPRDRDRRRARPRLDRRPAGRAPGAAENPCRPRAISIRSPSSPAASALDQGIDAHPRGLRAARPHIFNLGHGILPETPIAHVDAARCARGPEGCLSMLYLWLKAFHVVAVIAWMAAMLYLPRLFVYHCDAPTGSIQSETFKVMERRLLKAIIDSGDDRDLGPRPGPRLAGRLDSFGLAAREARPRPRPVRAARHLGEAPARTSPPTATRGRPATTASSTRSRRC